MRPPSQLKKFRDIFAKLIGDVNSDQGNSIEIIDEIKKELKKELPTVYEEWENSGFDINFKFKLQNAAKKITETTLLHLAIFDQIIPCTSIIRYLLDTGANPNLQDSDNQTPLYMAAITKGDKNKEIVKLLLERGADPNIAESCGQTPLQAACMFYDKSFNVETIKLLLNSGGNINKKDNERNTPLHQLVDTSIGISENSPTILKEQSLELVKLFVKHGASIYTRNKSRKTPKDLIESRRLSTFSMNKELANSIEQFLEAQESSREYHGKLLELLEQTKDLKFLTGIIDGNGVMSEKGIQLCSQAIPEILGISGIEIAVKGTIVEGKIEKEFSHGTGWPIVDVEGNTLKYHDLFNGLISLLGTNSVIMSLPYPKQSFLGWKVSDYVINNQESIKREFWGEHEIDSTPETEKGNVTRQHVAQKDPAVKQHVKKKTKGNANEEKRKEINDTSYTDKKTMVNGRSTFSSGVYPQKEAKDPPIFSRKQKIAIAIGVVTALATALTCYSLQLPALAIVASTLIAGIGAYVVSSKLYDVSVCNSTGQQPGL
ncbi:MAG: Protein PhlB [Wolbachia endosymbiont of Ctenocephalides felis wCfeF]|nr:MAG: Protein PhlB [Wolbachia endosymbiont of Ctenocephalides felis wCfeF]